MSDAASVSRAETIRRALRVNISAAEHEEVLAALDALVAENDRLREAAEQQDEVISLVTEYVDDILDRARSINAPHKARVDAGPFVLYVEQRLDELAARVAKASNG